MSHITRHSHASHYLLYINSRHRLYNITALDQLPLSSQVVHSTQQVSWSSSSSTYIGIALTNSNPLRIAQSIMSKIPWRVKRSRHTIHTICQVQVYSGRGSSQVRTKTDEGGGQRAGQEISPAGVGDCLDSTTKDNEH